jgi:HTH-type transcriptional regulator/antitoxin HigA
LLLLILKDNGRLSNSSVHTRSTTKLMRQQFKQEEKTQMEIKLIKTEKDYQQALKKFEKLFDAPKGTKEGDEAKLLSILIDNYEKEHYPIEAPDPIEAIKYIMEEKGLSNKDVVQYFGSKSLVTQVLKKERSLSLKMIRALHRGLGLPYEILLAN